MEGRCRELRDRGGSRPGGSQGIGGDGKGSSGVTGADFVDVGGPAPRAADTEDDGTWTGGGGAFLAGLPNPGIFKAEAVRGCSGCPWQLGVPGRESDVVRGGRIGSFGAASGGGNNE